MCVFWKCMQSSPSIQYVYELPPLYPKWCQVFQGQYPPLHILHKILNNSCNFFSRNCSHDETSSHKTCVHETSTQTTSVHETSILKKPLFSKLLLMKLLLIKLWPWKLLFIILYEYFCLWKFVFIAYALTHTFIIIYYNQIIIITVGFQSILGLI